MLDKTLKLSREISVGPQPGEEELKALAARGVKTVVNLCYKGELGQAQALKPDEEQELADELGLGYLHFPVSVANWTVQHVNELYELILQEELPVYIHCRIGQRALPFGLIFHAIRKNLSTAQAFKRADKIGVNWSAPVLRSFVESYLSDHRPATSAEQADP